MATRPLKVLVLCHMWPGNANTIRDHIEAFERYSRHQIRTFDPVGMSRSRLLDLNEFDVVVIHYSLVLSLQTSVSGHFVEMLARYRGLKVQFIQDEYRWVDRATAASRRAGIDVLFTSAPEPAAGLLYDERLPGVRRVMTLTGYVPQDLTRRPRRPLSERQIDVGYRGRDLPFWLGRLSYEKQMIGRRFMSEPATRQLRRDVGWTEADRIYGDRWVEFVGSCRATLGSESGASIADFDGKVEAQVRAYLKSHPEAPFEEVSEAVLRPFEGNVVVGVVSPRVFEAAALGTALVMFPGAYSGVVEPREHYILLEKDFSNIGDVVEQLKDQTLIEAMSRRAFDHVVSSQNWSYAAFVREFDDVVAEEARPIARPGAFLSYRLGRLERRVRVPSPYARIAHILMAAVIKVRGRDFTRRSTIESGAWFTKAMLALRVAVTDPDMRPILRQGRRDGVALDDLLEEILELWLLRQARGGSLRAAQPFTVRTVFDDKAGSLLFVSRNDSNGSPETGLNGSAYRGIDASGVKTIAWDHSAVGTAVNLARPPIDVSIGTDGVKRFSLLTDIGRRRPAVVENLVTRLLAKDARTSGLA